MTSLVVQTNSRQCQCNDKEIQNVNMYLIELEFMKIVDTNRHQKSPVETASSDNMRRDTSKIILLRGLSRESLAKEAVLLLGHFIKDA